MIGFLINSDIPFSVVKSTESLIKSPTTDWHGSDYFLVTVRNVKGFVPHNHGILRTYTLTPDEVVWFKNNQKLFKIVVNDKTGRVYEPIGRVSLRKVVNRCRHLIRSGMVDLFWAGYVGG